MNNSNNKSKKNQEPLEKNEELNPPIQSSTKEKKSVNQEKGVEKDLIKIDDFYIPEVPEPPKKSTRLTLNSPGLSAQILKEVKDLENNSTKVVLVNCDRCKEVIAIPIPRKFVDNSEIPVVPVSYVHKNPKKKDLHCITLYLDNDFDIRRQRISDVVVSKNVSSN